MLHLIIYSFIENYGTHVVVGISMGGQDVVYVKQDKSSQLPLCEIKYNLDKLGDQLFTGICTLPLQQRKSKENKSKVCYHHCFFFVFNKPTWGYYIIVYIFVLFSTCLFGESYVVALNFCRFQRLLMCLTHSQEWKGFLQSHTKR